MRGEWEGREGHGRDMHGMACSCVVAMWTWVTDEKNVADSINLNEGMNR